MPVDVRSSLIAIALFANASLLTACSGEAPVRLAFDTDTLLSGTSRQMTVPVYAMASDGRIIRHPRLGYSTNSTVVQLSSDGHVECRSTGDAVVTITARQLVGHVVVLCRPHVWLGLTPNLWNEPLWVGSPPRDVAVVAYDGSARSPMHLPHGTATARVRYDSVARIIGGRVYALSAGVTPVDIAFDGTRGDAQIRVVDRVTHETLQLAGDEYRLWHLPPGYYELRLETPPQAIREARLVLGAYDANCARAPRDDGQHYFCIFKASSSVIVRNSQPPGTRLQLRGELSVFRLP